MIILVQSLLGMTKNIGHAGVETRRIGLSKIIY